MNAADAPMTAREIALDAFWTERPLVQLFRETTGRAEFSLKQLIEFAEQLPQPVIESIGEQS